MKKRKIERKRNHLNYVCGFQYNGKKTKENNFDEKLID